MTDDATTRVELRVEGDVTESQIAIGHHIVQIGDVEAGARVTVNMAPDAEPPTRLPGPVALLPRRARPPLDRRRETEQALADSQVGFPVEFYGEQGIGKSTLLRHVAHEAPATGSADGIVFLRASGRPLEDLQLDLYDAFYQRRPDWRPTETQIRQALQDVSALIVLDDVELPRDELDALLDSLPASVLVSGSTTRRLWSDGLALPLGGLPLDDAVILFELEVGQPLDAESRAEARDLCEALGGHPLRIREAAALARERRKSLAALTAVARADPGTTTAELLAELTPTEGKVASALAVAGGEALSTQALAAVAGPDAVEPALNTLAARKLIEEGEHRRWSLTGPATGLLRADDLSDVGASLVSHLAESPRARRPEDLAEETPAILATLRWAAAAERWDDVRKLSQAIETALARSGRWGAWAETLDSLLEASEALAEPATEAYARHQLGTKLLLTGDEDAARAQLRRAAEIRREIGDERGAEASEHNLELVSAPPPGLWEQIIGALGAKGLAALVALVVAGGTTAGIFLAREGGATTQPSLAEESLHFGSVTVGSSTERQLSVASGAESQTITAISTSSSEFLAAPDCLRPLPSGEACSIRIAFAPAGIGPRTDELEVSLATGTVLQAELAGTGIAPPTIPRLAEERLDFGAVELGESKSLVITFEAGSQPQTIAAISTSSDAFRPSEDCIGTVAAGAGCAIAVEFAPASTDTTAGSLTVALADGGSLAAELSGIGVRVAGPIPPTLEPESIDFGEVFIGESSRETVTLSAGEEAFELATIGATSREFALTTTCGEVVAADASCTIGVAFSPAATGARVGALTVERQDGTSLAVALEGTGVGIVQPSLDHQRLAFGDVEVGKSTDATITFASGSRTRTISAISTAGSQEFTAAQDCLGERSAGSTCGIAVTFTPGATGPESATLTVTLSDGTTLSSALSGNGFVTADLRVFLRTPSSATEGRTLSAFVVISNLGPATATNVVLDVSAVPAGVSSVTLDPESSTCKSVPCDLGTVSRRRAIRLVFRVGQRTEENATISIAVKVRASERDPNAGDDGDTRTVEVVPVIVD